MMCLTSVCRVIRLSRRLISRSNIPHVIISISINRRIRMRCRRIVHRCLCIRRMQHLVVVLTRVVLCRSIRLRRCRVSSVRRMMMVGSRMIIILSIDRRRRAVSSIASLVRSVIGSVRCHLVRSMIRISNVCVFF